MGLLANLAFMVLFAWVVRGLLSARELTWPRTFLAVVFGTLLGALVAGFILIDTADLADPTQLDVRSEELFALALPFQVVATMIAVVGLELISSRPPKRRELRPVRPWRAVARRLRIVGRMAQVARIASRHGLAPALGLRRGDVDTRSSAELEGVPAAPSRTQAGCSSSPGNCSRPGPTCSRPMRSPSSDASTPPPVPCPATRSGRRSQVSCRSPSRRPSPSSTRSRSDRRRTRRCTPRGSPTAGRWSSNSGVPAWRTWSSVTWRSCCGSHGWPSDARRGDGPTR